MTRLLRTSTLLLVLGAVRATAQDQPGLCDADADDRFSRACVEALAEANDRDRATAQEFLILSLTNQCNLNVKSQLPANLTSAASVFGNTVSCVVSGSLAIVPIDNSIIDRVVADGGTSLDNGLLRLGQPFLVVPGAATSIEVESFIESFQSQNIPVFLPFREVDLEQYTTLVQEFDQSGMNVVLDPSWMDDDQFRQAKEILSNAGREITPETLGDPLLLEQLMQQ